ncbi:dihydrofolate reductase family protein [Chitinophaga qingshengii]|uniref:Dihydrofolate reductase family protein n=1 Tax=Chitinophaga qingshengii TaxID=1569794 RepID=A0ABR7TN26_9BACT|nr:dihydrofolate reductase family protein [Chitinophaga qingshengii]MBC9930911.1 dihydrofolate reductase family protein [Chitinophaga qingshengii]
MRKLILQMQLSIDGFAAAGNGNGSWMVWNYGDNWTWDTALQAYHTTLMASADEILLSRKMAEEGFISHWENMAANTANPQSVFAGHIRDARKVVFTHTLQASRWPNTILAQGDLVTEVNTRKQQPGDNILVFGGVAFVSALIAARLIDEYHLIINPTAIGNGMPIFDQLQGMLGLSLIKATAYPCGIVVLQYRYTD